MSAESLTARIARGHQSHTEDDVLGHSVALKNRFAQIRAYPGLRPDNALLRAADRAEVTLNRFRRLRPLSQYVLLDLVRV